MKNKSALYIQYAGSGFIGWLSAGAYDNMLQAMLWILAWIAVCMMIRMVVDK